MPTKEQILKQRLNHMDQILQDKLTDNNINKMFNHIKEQIKIPAQIKKHYIKNNILFVEMSISIDQFYQWLSNNYRPGCICVRKLWYKFLDYVKDIFDYGYHFTNITNINKFIEFNHNPISILDGVISYLPYNICSAADINKPEITNDKNNFNFNIIAEAFEKDDKDIDKDVTNYLGNLIQEDDENEDEEIVNEENNNDSDEEIQVETKEEEMNRLIGEYKNGGECHAQIAYKVLKDSQNQLDDITFIKSMELTPRIIKHSQNNNCISLLWSISKTQFINTFSIFRQNNAEQVWQDFKNDFKNNYNQYTCINKKFMNDYLVSIHCQLDHIINDFVDIDISKENNVKFKSIIQII